MKPQFQALCQYLAPLLVWGRRAARWTSSVPSAVLAAMGVTSVFSSVVLAGSEMFFSQAATLRVHQTALADARIEVQALRRRAEAAVAWQHSFKSSHAAADLAEGESAWGAAARHDAALMAALSTAWRGQAGNQQALRAAQEVHAAVRVNQEQAHIAARLAFSGRPSAAIASLRSPTTREAQRRLFKTVDVVLQALDARAAALERQGFAVFVKQRAGATVLVGINLLLLSVLAARTIRHFYAQEGQRLSLADEARELEAAAEERTAELADLTTYVQRQSEREKSRLARELHDEFGALLIAAKLDVHWMQSRGTMDAENVRRLARLDQMLERAVDLKRRVIENLRPSMLDHLGLGPSLAWYVEDTCEKAGLAHRIEVPAGALRVDTEAALTLYRITQEALTNIVAHANASEVHVRLVERADAYELCISDDGVGFARSRGRQVSHGLAGMRHRARAHGGELNVASTVGHGTRIVATIPRQAQPVSRQSALRRPARVPLPQSGDEIVLSCV